MMPMSAEMLRSNNSLRTLIENRGGLRAHRADGVSSSTTALANFETILTSFKTLLVQMVAQFGANLTPDMIQGLVDQVMALIGNAVLPFMGPLLGPLVVRFAKQIITNWIMSVVKPNVPTPSPLAMDSGAGQFVSADSGKWDAPSIVPELSFDVRGLVGGTDWRETYGEQPKVDPSSSVG